LVLGNEMFLCSAYLLAFKDSLYLPYALLYSINFIFGIGLVLFVIKKVMSVIQLISASEDLAEMDMKERKAKEQ
jgi:hypothetical protein